MNKEQITILIVEDDPFLLGMYSTKFELEGFRVISASDGQIGLEKANLELPDVILLDIMMPKKDGFGVLDVLKKDKNTKDIPVILLTNLNQASDIQKAQDMGVKDYLIKAHYMPHEIVEKVKNILK